MSEPSSRNRDPRDEQGQPEKRPNALQVIWSVIAALFGVQSQKNRDRDFRKGDPRDYIVVYVVLVIVLVAGMIMVVNAVLESAGK